VKGFDLERCYLESCSECEGKGLAEDSFRVNLCPKCGGFGLVKNGKEPLKRKGRRKALFKRA
jgi:DnaJ-class molecular chaperone